MGLLRERITGVAWEVSLLAHEVEFDVNGFAFVRISIKPKHSQRMLYVDYKIDSGANRTTISCEQLVKLGFDEQWIRTGKLLEGGARPTVASGLPVEDCYEVILPEINIGGCVGYNWPFITSLSVSFKFLLGTDTMRYFNWEFDYEHGLCRFDLIPGMRRVLYNNSEQSIHSVDEFNK